MKKTWVALQGISLGCNHLLTDRWRHASAEGLRVGSVLTSTPHPPVAQAKSTTHRSAKYPSPPPRGAAAIHPPGAACLPLRSGGPGAPWVCFLVRFAQQLLLAKREKTPRDPHPLRCCTNKSKHKKIGRMVAHGCSRRGRTVAHSEAQPSRAAVPT